MSTGEKKKFPDRSLYIAAAIIAAAAVFYYLFDPLDHDFMPQCVFHRITGLQCVGCGSQRMLHALLHGDIAGAFRANAFALLSLPAIVFLIWVETRRTRHPALYRKVFSPLLIAVTGILLVSWMIARNIIGI